MSVESTNEESLSLFSPEDMKILKLYSPIGHDIDGVTAYTALMSIEALNRKGKQFFPRNMALSDLEHPWMMTEWFKYIFPDLDEKGLILETRNHWNSHEVVSNSIVLPGAAQVLNELHNNKIEHYFVTQRPFDVADLTFSWFSKNLPLVNPMQLLIQSSEEYNSHFKVEAVGNFGMKLVFEDFSEEALKIVEETGAIVGLVNHPWNKDCPNHPRIVRPPLDPRYDANLLATYDAVLAHLYKVVQ